LRAELELGLGESDAATQTLAELPPAGTDLPDVMHHLRAAGCLLELGALDAAEGQLETVLKREPDSADALHLLGLVSEAKGDREKMIERFTRVRALDLKAPPSEHTITIDRLEERAQAALEELPAEARKLLGNVPIVIEDYPSQELVGDGLDPRLLGLFSGVPYPEQSTLSGQPPHLECVLLFKRNIERDARSLEEIDDEIRTTLLHETGHFFGLDEDDLEKLGLD
jgi:predicted Zn-dependent protease with MMP-like domain